MLSDSFEFFLNFLKSIGIFWIHLSLQAVSVGRLCRLSLQAVFVSSLCKHFLQLNALNTLESLRAAYLAWQCSSSELLSCSLGILGA